MVEFISKNLDRQIPQVHSILPGSLLPLYNSSHTPHFRRGLTLWRSCKNIIWGDKGILQLSEWWLSPTSCTNGKIRVHSLTTPIPMAYMQPSSSQSHLLPCVSLPLSAPALSVSIFHLDFCTVPTLGLHHSVYPFTSRSFLLPVASDDFL